MNPFNYFKCDDKYKMEFVNEYQALTKSRDRKRKFLVKLDAFLFGQDHIVFHLPQYQRTLRDFFQHQRIPKQLPLIFTNVFKGIEELYTLGYVHKDFKTENIMLDFSPLRVVIIDFNRSQRVQASGLDNVYGTPGQISERKDWRICDINWDIWGSSSINCLMRYRKQIITTAFKEGKIQRKQYSSLQTRIRQKQNERYG